MESPKARTSEIEWTITYMQGRDAGLVERHITRTVGDTVWQVNMGDETGCHWTTYRRSVGGHSEEARRNAEFPKEELAGPRHSLVHDGVVWHVEHQMGQVPLGGFAIPAGEPTIYEPFDFAAPGLRVYWPQLPSNAIGLRDSVLEGFEDAEWSVTSHGNIDLVTAEEQLALWDKITEQWRAKYLKDHGEAPWLLSKTEEPDEWDLYVAEFIKKHKLDEPRIKRANELLERSKKLRDYHKRKNRSKIEKAKREGDEEKQAKYEAITRRIFDKVLVRGLNKLLPDTQQVAASAKTE